MVDAFSTLVEMFEISCAKYAATPLFGTRSKQGWRWLTYAEFAEQVAACRGGLAARGVKAGDTVAILSNNCVEWAVVAHASYSLGAALVPMYEAQVPEDWEYILKDAACRVAVCGSKKSFEAVEKCRENLPALQHVIGLRFPPEHVDSWQSLLEHGRKEPCAVVRPATTDVACILYTSGTMGEPKGVVLTHDNFASNVRSIRQVLPLEGERALSFLPWAHAFGQTAELHTFLSAGMTVAINDDVGRLLDNLPEVKPTVLASVPRIYSRIYDRVNAQMADRPSAVRALFRAGIADARRRNRGERLGPIAAARLFLADKLIFSKIRARFGGEMKWAVSGSAALGREVGEFIDALGIKVYEGYGLTETSPVVTVNSPEHHRMGSVGRPLPGVRVVIDESQVDEPGQGEILVYGPCVMRGYHNRPEETEKTIRPDGGLRTGDMGRIDADGFLFITGRIKEQYKLQNGKYVVPSPLEEKLKLSPYVANVMLYGANHAHNVCLVVADKLAVTRWARAEGIELGDLTKNERVKKLLWEEIKRCAADFKGYERPHAIAVIAEDFTIDNGLLTPKLSLKRKECVKRYSALLEALYR